MLLPVIIAIVLVAGLGLALFTLGGRASKVGTLSRETKTRDKRTRRSASTVVETEVVAADGEATDPLPPAPVRLSADELGVNRRKFLNRSLLSMVGLGGLAPFGASLLAFIWPPEKKTPKYNAEKKKFEFVPASSGFGGKITAGSVADITAFISANRSEY